MTITFFGHSEITSDRDNIEKQVSKIFCDLIEADSSCTFLCGHKGTFDIICEKCIDSLKQAHGNIQKIYITPYYSDTYQKSQLQLLKNMFDEIIFPPPCERCYKKFAYSRRNEWMIENADVIVFYLKYNWGGTFSSYRYAKHINKEIILVNL